MDLERLKDKFQESEIEWRVQSSGKQKNGQVWALIVPYVTNRAIMDRLDFVCGMGEWSNKFEIYDKGVLCSIEIEAIVKQDGADYSEIESFKGGISGAMKRAAVQWGIGRYLYNMPNTYALISDEGKNRSYNKKEKFWFKWDVPKMKKEFLPEKKPEKKPENKEDPAKDFSNKCKEAIATGDVFKLKELREQRLKQFGKEDQNWTDSFEKGIVEATANAEKKVEQGELINE